MTAIARSTASSTAAGCFCRPTAATCAARRLLTRTRGARRRAVPVPDRRFIVRFHLHPAVKATLAQSGQAVLMRLPSGRGWRLRAPVHGPGAVDVTYLGEEGRVRRSEQIVLVGRLPLAVNEML